MAVRRPLIMDSMFLATATADELSLAYAAFAHSDDISLRVLASIDMLGGEIHSADVRRVMKDRGDKK